MATFGTPGARIGYQVYQGPEDAPAILLVHGFTASSASFMDNITPLRKYFHVITCDLLGHGESDAPADPLLYGPSKSVERILGLLDHLRLEQVLIVGHSLGGAVALRAVLDAPSRFAGVVVINSSSAAGDPRWRETAAAGLREMAARSRVEGPGFLKTTNMYPAASKRLPRNAQRALANDFERLRGEGVAGTAEGLVAQVNAWERLPDLDVPALIVIGDRDRAFAKLAPAFLERLPAAYTRWIVLKDAGHAANLEQSAAFVSAVVAFARDCGYLPPGPPKPRRGDRLSTGLFVFGGALVAGGVALLLAAFFAGGGDSTPAAGGAAADAVEETDTATPTAVDTVAAATTAATREPTTARRPSATAIVASIATPPAPVASVATATEVPPAPTATAVALFPTATPFFEPEPTIEPGPPAEPTIEPEPTATQPPAGPGVGIAGPGSAAVGETVFFQAVAAEEPPFGWQWSSCAQGTTASSCSATYTADGCYAVQVTGFYPDGAHSAVYQVAIGDGVCQ